MKKDKDIFKGFVNPAPFNMSGAFGNGYVVIPKGHHLYGKDYSDKIFDDIKVNGGLTYSEEEWENLGLGGDGWVLGFDTQHFHDSFERWPDEESVMKEQQEKIR